MVFQQPSGSKIYTLAEIYRMYMLDENGNNYNEDYTHIVNLFGVMWDITQRANIYSFISDYAVNSIQYDKILLSKYGHRRVKVDNFLDDPNLQPWAEVVDRFYNRAFLFNSDNLQKMYDALQLEYNPIENYDKMSDIKTTFFGKETNTLGKSGTSTNELTRTGVETDSVSQASDTVTHKSSPDSDESFYSSSKDEMVNGARTNQHTYNNRKDTQVNSFNNYKEENVKEYTNRIDHIEERTHGNVGVTTSMQMLSEESQGRVKLEFMLPLLERVINELTF